MMKEREIIRLFLKRGYQISTGALELLPENPEQIIDRFDDLKPRPFVITRDHVKKVLESEKKPELQKLKEFRKEKKALKTNDYLDYFTSKYERLKNILLQNPGLEKLMSINKITPKTTDFSIIGMIREKTDDGLILEDLTGETEIIVDRETIEKTGIILDDVIGVKCRKINDRNVAESVYLPDIPINRNIARSERNSKIMVVSNIANLSDEKYRNFMELAGNTDDLVLIFHFYDEPNMKNVITGFDSVNICPKEGVVNPTFFQLDALKILVLPRWSYPKTFNSQEIKSILKNRMVFPHMDEKNIFVPDSFLDDIPDLVLSNFEKSLYENYKGTTIISLADSNKTFLIDLKTREVFEKSI